MRTWDLNKLVNRIYGTSQLRIHSRYRYIHSYYIIIVCRFNSMKWPRSPSTAGQIGRREVRSQACHLNIVLFLAAFNGLARLSECRCFEVRTFGFWELCECDAIPFVLSVFFFRRHQFRLIDNTVIIKSLQVAFYFTLKPIFLFNSLVFLFSTLNRRSILSGQSQRGILTSFFTDFWFLMMMITDIFCWFNPRD